MQAFDFLLSPAEVVAPRLLGCDLVRNFNGQKAAARIVETEAYHQSDAASHSYRGQTPRTSVMFGSPGHLYVYFTYGMHYCCNIVTGPAGEGSAVLIRALEPLSGFDLLKQNRPGFEGASLTNGPAKLCQALAINDSLNGHNLARAPLVLKVNPAVATDQIIQSTRIGISRAQDVPWRFYLKGNAYVSRP